MYPAPELLQGSGTILFRVTEAVTLKACDIPKLNYYALESHCLFSYTVTACIVN